MLAFPTFRKIGQILTRVTRIPRRIFLSKTSLKVYLVTGSALYLGCTGLRWYDLRALAKEQDRVAALGIARDFRELRVPPVADADNFFAAPPFAGVFAPPYPDAPQLCLWFGWRLPKGTPELPPELSFSANLAERCDGFRKIGTLPQSTASESPAQALASDQRFGPVIRSIYAAAERPTARWPDKVPDDGYAYPTPRTDFGAMAKGIQFYARANLELGNMEQVLPAFRVFRHLIAASADKGNNWSGVIFLDHQKPLLLEGIAAHRLPQETLQAILKENYPEMMRRSARRSMESDRIHFVEDAQTIRMDWNVSPGMRSLPETTKQFYHTFVMRRQALQYSRYQVDLITRAVPLAEGETWAGRTSDLPGTFIVFNQYRVAEQRPDFFWRLIRPVLKASLHHTAAALELHWLKHGRYPAALAGLEGGLPENALLDGKGQPFGYSTDAEGAHFTLSAGEKTDPWSTMPAKP